MSRGMKWSYGPTDTYFGMLSNKRSEVDVTVRVTDSRGEDRLISGFYRELGAPVTGESLDPDPEFLLEFSRPEIEVVILGYSGSIKAVSAWVSTMEGPQVVLDKEFPEPMTVLADESLTVVGPAY